MTTPAPLPDEAKSLWAYLSKALRSRVVRKDKASIMRIAARIAARRTDTTREEFMHDFVTTLGRRIFVPFTIGEEVPAWSLRSQMLLAVHEHQHVAQWRARPVRFWVRYARDTRKRALLEAEALLSEFEACQAFGWPLPDIEQRLGTLAGYGLTDADRAAARDWLVDRVSLLSPDQLHMEWTRAGRIAGEWAAKRT